MSNDFIPLRNSSGLPDPTAMHAVRNVLNEQNEVDERANQLIHVLKKLIHICGFRLLSRIEVADVKSGREYR